MFMKVLAVCAFFLAVLAPGLTAGEVQADPALYGPYPTNYKEIVNNWLNSQLIDPVSARIEWVDEPKAVDLGKQGEHLYGYIVHFKVNARNRFGAFTGKQKHAVLIRNGEVVKGLGFGY